MCGRYATGAVSWEDYRRLLTFKVDNGAPALKPRYNITPHQTAPIFRFENGDLSGSLAYWNLVPRGWSKSPGEFRYSTFNARIDDIEGKRAFAPSFLGTRDDAPRRCIVPAIGLYEWTQGAQGRDPWFISAAGFDPQSEEPPLWFAGIWERSHVAQRDNPSGPRTELISFAIITAGASEWFSKYHDKKRQAVTLAPEDFDGWLAGDAAAAKRLCQPWGGNRLQAWPVARDVNAARGARYRDNSGLIAPIPAE